MTKSDVMKEFLKKTVIPVVVALFLFSMFSRIFIENGAPDYFLIWLASSSRVQSRNTIISVVRSGNN